MPSWTITLECGHRSVPLTWDQRTAARQLGLAGCARCGTPQPVTDVERLGGLSVKQTRARLARREATAAAPDTGQNSQGFLLHEIPRHDRPTKSVLRRAAVEHFGDQFDPRALTRGLLTLKHRGLAEKWHPPGANGSSWRLTPAGAAKLEEIELRLAEDRTSAER